MLVVEGILDAWRMGPGTVATFGMGVENHQISALANLDVREYFIMFDAEPQAQKNADSLGKTLKQMTGRDVQLLQLTDGDPDDLDDIVARSTVHNLGIRDAHATV